MLSDSDIARIEEEIARGKRNVERDAEDRQIMMGHARERDRELMHLEFLTRPLVLQRSAREWSLGWVNPAS